MFFFMYAVSDWLCVVGFVCILTETELSSSSFSLHIFIHEVTSDPHCTTFCDCEEKF